MSRHREALAYLVRATAANHLARQLARIRNPRYALALIAGALYLWFALIGRSSWSRPGAALPGLMNIAAIGFAATVIVWWMGKGAYLALAFRPAEVQFLFPAPLSRRTLIVYKLVRSQMLLVVNAIVWALIIRRWGVALPWPLRIATTWGYFTVLSLHRLGVALVQARPVRGLRRLAGYAGRGLAVAAVLALVAGIGPSVLRLDDVGFPETMRAVGRALTVPPASYAMAPFRLIVAPMFAPSVEAWLRAFAVVSGIVTLHVVWVLAMHVEFEEEAAVASEALARRRAAFRERRAGRSAVIGKRRVARDWLPLGARGHPAVAIAWKNTIALARTGSLRTLMLFAVFLAVLSRIMSAGASASAGAALAIPYLGLAAIMLVLGPRILRNDLRQDLLSMSLLKTYPLSGREIVAAEVLSPTLALAAFQLAMLIVAYLAIPADSRLVLGGVRTVTIATLTPFALIALNAVGLVIQNAAALLFPGWVRLGPDSGGVEAAGQNLLVMVGATVTLVVTLIVPAVVGLVTLLLTRPAFGDLALGAGGAAAIVVLGAEVALLVRALGTVFDRTEPTALG